MTVYEVTDDVSAGNPDSYAIFSTEAKAQAWIDRQRDRKYPWWKGLIIEPRELDRAIDLGRG